MKASAAHIIRVINISADTLIIISEKEITLPAVEVYLRPFCEKIFLDLS